MFRSLLSEHGTKLPILFLCFVFLVTACFAQTQQAGIQMFSTNEFGLDLASGTINLQIPLRSKPVGPNPMSALLVGTSWLQPSRGEDYIWAPPLFVDASPGGLLGTQLQFSVNSCNEPPAEIWFQTLTGLTDVTGTFHGITPFTIGPCQAQSGQGTAVDGSGYTVTGTYNSSNGYLTYVVYDPSGNYLTHSFTQTGYSTGAFTVTTPDGVTITVGATGFVDALTSTQFLIPSVDNGGAQYTGTDTYQYYDANGNTQQYSAIHTTSLPARTNFGCGTGQLDGHFYNYPITAITLPGSNGQYAIGYEATQGFPGDITGRIASITYPSGGSVSYAYSGGNTGQGLNCWDNTYSPTTITVKTNDNNGNVGTWTYTNNISSSTQTNFTVTRTGPPTPLSPNGDQVAYSFNGEFLTEKQVYQGAASGTPLLTTVYCYNGNLSGCAAPTSNITLPIKETDTYTTPGGMSRSTRSQRKYDPTYGNLTYLAEYDFGATTPTSQKYFFYGQSWNGTTCTAYPSGSFINNTPCFIEAENGSGTPLAQTKMVYSNTGHPTSISSWVSGSNWLTTTIVYTPTGVVQLVTEPNTAVTQYSNFVCNDLVPMTITFPLASVGSASANPPDCNGGVTTLAMDVNNNQYTYSYNDPLYRFTGVSYPDGGTESISYSQSSLPWKVTSTQAINSTQTASITTVLDGFGRVVQSQTVDPSSPTGYNYTNVTYNNLGQKLSVTNPFFTTSDPTYGITSFAYDALGRVTQITNPDSTYSTLTYYERAVKMVDETGLTTISQANGLSSHSECMVVSATQANGATPSACGLDIAGSGFLGTVNYDALGRVTSSILSSQTRSFNYDGLSRVTQEVTPEAGSITFTYDSGTAGDLYQRVAPRANQSGSAQTTTTYAWDLMHRPTGASYTDGTPTATLSYDQSSALGQQLANYKGKMTYAATAGAATANQSAFSYDAVGRGAYVWSCTPLTCGTSTQELGATYNYDDSAATFTDYNTLPNRASGVTFSYAYNAAQVLSGLSSNYTINSSFPATLFTASTINALGALTKFTYDTGALANTTSLSYDSRGRNTSRSNGTLYSYSLAFNGNDTVQSSTDSTNGAWNYTYDGFGRLSTAVETSPSQSFAYQYDQYGNRWGTNSGCSSTNPSACQYVFNTNNQITTGGITYDAAGNMTYDGTYTYAYDAEGRITNVQQGSTQVASYIYDAFGRRTQEAVGTSSTYTFVFDFAGRPYEKLEYTKSAGEFFQQTQLFAGVMPIGFYHSSSATTTGATNFFVDDWKGTVSQITATGGGSNGSCSGYLPFGDGGTCTGTGSNWGMPGYAGTWNDLETGLDKTDTRFLSPIQGRFLTPDPARSGWNLYVYGNNDPVSQTDPSGLFVDSAGDFGDAGCDPGCDDDGSEPDPQNSNAQPADPQNPDSSGIPLLVPTGVPLVCCTNLPDNIPMPDFGTNTPGGCFSCAGFNSLAPEFIKEEIMAAWAKPVGAPGVWESAIPIWGSGRAAINNFQTGHWGWGLVNTGLAISDVFLVKSLATAGAKLAIAGVATVTEKAAIGATGAVGETALKQLGGDSQVFFKTGLGRRFVDQFADGVINESKVGYTTLTSTVQKQIQKDAWLVANNQQVESAAWHFFQSPVTGLVGPSGPLREALTSAGIKIVCPACP